MRRLLWRRAAAIIAICALAPLTFCVSGVVATATASASPEITGTGSSFAALAILQWASDLDSYGLNVNYSTQSSVVGLNQFASQAVNFGASEIGYSTNQANPPGFAYQYLPDVAGGIAFAYNLTGANGQKITSLRLSPAALVGIWTDRIQTWDNPLIQAENPGVALPNIPIKVIYRSDGAGESYLLSWYLSYMFPTAWAQYLQAIDQGGAPLSAYYPVWQPGTPLPPGYNFNNWLGQSGSDAAAHYVSESGSDGAITYVETSWARYYNLAYAYMQNPAGYWVQPGYVNVSIALEKAVLYKDLEQNLDGVFTNPLPQAYPLSSYSYILTQEGEVDPSIGAALSQFIYFLGCQGQSQTIQLGYAPLPPNLVRDDFDAAERLNGHQAPPPLNASGCKNPYIDGQIPLPGEPIVTGQAPTPPTTRSPGSAPGGQSGTTVPGSSNATQSTGPGSAAAGGTAATSGSRGPVTLHPVTVSSWSAPDDVDGRTPLDAVTCPTGSFCVAVDGAGRALSYSAKGWSRPASVDGSTALDAVSCAEPRFCVAVDRRGHAIVYDGGSAWSKAIDIDGASPLESVTCPSSTFCVAVDAGGRAVTYKNGRWGRPAIVDGPRSLSAVSCSSMSSCVAVDRTGRALNFNGTEWSAPTVVDRTHGGISALSCPTASSCDAVDQGGYVVPSNGAVWVAPHKIDGTRTIDAVSCSTAGLCAAVDASGHGVVYRPPVWGPAEDIDGATPLTSVSCPTGGLCVAVDGAGRALIYRSKTAVLETAASGPSLRSPAAVPAFGPTLSGDLAATAKALNGSSGWNPAMLGWAGGLIVLCAALPGLVWWRSRRRGTPEVSS